FGRQPTPFMERHRNFIESRFHRIFVIRKSVRTVNLVCCLCSVALLASGFVASAGTLTGSFESIPQGGDVNLTVEGPIDWVHWGLYAETSLDRKAGVTPWISGFTRLDASNGYSYVYRFADNYNSYSWSDGTPTASVTNTPTGVWAYGVPTKGSGFRLSVP